MRKCDVFILFKKRFHFALNRFQSSYSDKNTQERGSKIP